MKQRWLPLAASGDGLFCIGITEAEAGSAVPLMRAKLEEDGDGYRLNAYKNYVTGGHHAAACLVWCKFPNGQIAGYDQQSSTFGAITPSYRTYKSWGTNGSYSRFFGTHTVKLRLHACWVTQAPLGFVCSQLGGRGGCRVR